jgi:hypothetical protein
VGRIAYNIPDELHYKAKSLAALKGISLKAWIEQAMAAEIDRQERENDQRRRGRA